MSTPTTSPNFSASATATGSPTYPRPMTAMRSLMWTEGLQLYEIEMAHQGAIHFCDGILLVAKAPGGCAHGLAKRGVVGQLFNGLLHRFAAPGSHQQAGFA